MGLQVWLPLNGNIDNQGLTPVTLSVGSPTYTSGKIGQCLNTTLAFNVSNNLITNLGSTNTYSMCCWCKDLNTSTGSRWVFSISSGTGTTRGLWENNSSTSRHWGYSGGGVNLSTSINTIDGNWHHICFTSAGSVVKLYVDGIYQSQVTSASTTAMTANIITLNANDYNLNDFRLYDHVLSPREIKEISKGLVLHYPLSSSGGGCENLMKSSNFSITSGSNTSTVKIATLIPVGTTITVSVQVDADDVVWDSSSNYRRVGTEFYTQKSGTTGNQYFGTWAGQKLSSSENVVEAFTGSFHGRISKTFTTLGEVPALRDVGLYIQGVTSGTVRVSNPKVEIGSVATPWIPNAADTEYSTMGFNDGVEYDVSGYQYNGEKFGNLTYSTNTSRYNTCYEFDGSTTYVRLKHSLYSILRLARDEVTMNIWAYKDNWKDYESNGTSSQLYTMCGCQEGGGISIYVTGNGRFQFICGTGETSNTYKVSATPIGYVGTLPNGWHMLTLTFDGFNLNGYVDGKLAISNAFFTTKTPIYYNTGNTSIYIGVESGSGKHANLFWNGKLSDFRVYTTALSADDILELYHTPISLSNNGTLLTQGEYVES